MIVSKGWKSWASEEGVEVAMSPGRKEMLRERRWESSARFWGVGEESVEGRRSTVMLVEGGERALRCVKIEVPSSPAPRTRILVEDMLVVRIWQECGSG